MGTSWESPGHRLFVEEAMPKTAKKRTVIPRLREAELADLIDVLHGELKELTLLVLITRRQPRQLMQWQQRDVVPHVEALAREYNSLPPAPADSLLFPGLAQLPPCLLQLLTDFLVSLPAAMPVVGCQDECPGEGINPDR